MSKAQVEMGREAGEKECQIEFSYVQTDIGRALERTFALLHVIDA